MLQQICGFYLLIRIHENLSNYFQINGILDKDQLDLSTSIPRDTVWREVREMVITKIENIEDKINAILSLPKLTCP